MNQQTLKIDDNFFISYNDSVEEPLIEVARPYLDPEVDVYFVLVNEMDPDGKTTKNILNSSIFNPQLNQYPGEVNKEILYRYYDITTEGLIINKSFSDKYVGNKDYKYFALLDLIISNFNDIKVGVIPKCILSTTEKEISDEERKAMVEELKSIYNKNEKKEIKSK